jgi:hypothetical protein
MSLKEEKIPRKLLLRGLDMLNKALKAKEKKVEMLICGGASMCLYLKARYTTKDIDAMYGEKTIVEKEAKKIAKQLGVSEKWLNDTVVQCDPNSLRSDTPRIPFLELSNLTINTVTPQYLLAMKLLAARTTLDATDPGDVIYLFRLLNINHKEQPLALLQQYFPDATLEAKTKAMIDDVLKFLQHEKEFGEY